MISRLDWDSSFFGYEVGKMEVEKDLDRLRFKKEAKNFQLIYIYCQQVLTDLPENAQHVCTHLDWHMNVAQKNISFENNSITQVENGIFEINGQGIFQQGLLKSKMMDSAFSGELEGLALLSGRFSRFNLEKRFRNNEFEKLYIQWIRNALAGHEKVLVYKQENHIRGLITLVADGKAGRIGLIAVAEEWRGKGIGKQLIQAAFTLSRQCGLEMLYIGTQKINKAATELYQKMGFGLREKKEIYHWWKDSVVGKRGPTYVFDKKR